MTAGLPSPLHSRWIFLPSTSTAPRRSPLAAKAERAATTAKPRIADESIKRRKESVPNLRWLAGNAAHPDLGNGDLAGFAKVLHDPLGSSRNPMNVRVDDFRHRPPRLRVPLGAAHNQCRHRESERSDPFFPPPPERPESRADPGF